MSVVAAAVVGSAVVGIYSANRQAAAAEDASNAQQDAARSGIEEQRYQMDRIQELLAPYNEAGTAAVSKYEDMAGLNGNAAQKAALAAIQNGAEYQGLLKAGNNNILQNASATGGLRGGNTQDALARFSPQLLSGLINDQYSRLGKMIGAGENAALGEGNARLQTGSNIGNLLQQQGAARAGGFLAQGAEAAGYANAITGALGMYAGLGGNAGTAANAGATWGARNNAAVVGSSPGAAAE